MEEIRLQKVLAAAGLGSRRKCEVLIEQGRVKVDGEVVTELGSRVDPENAIIHVDGVRIAQASGHLVVAFHKPDGMVTAMSDPHGRSCVGDVFEDYPVRLFHVGRLDSDSEGLLLMTNDGELAQRLGHPSHGIVKTYVVKVEGQLDKADVSALSTGIEVEDRKVAVTNVKVMDATRSETVIEVSIHEGRNRIIRRMFDQIGHPVTRLVRTQVGPVRLGNLAPGKFRELGREDLGRLYSAVGM